MDLHVNNELSELEFKLEDEMGGQPVTPDNVDLPTLRGFLEEVETLIKGDVPGASLADSRLRIEPGSVKIIAFVSALLAADYRADMARLNEKHDLDVIQPKRAQIIERWQGRARRSPSRAYQIAVAPDLQPIRVANASQFQHGGENAWVSVEKYVTGKILDAGGKQSPNIHLELAESGETVTVNATEQQLGAEKENLLYKTVSLRVLAEQHLRTKEVRQIQLLQFLPQTGEVDEQALASLWQKGRMAWRDIKSAAGWVETVRGNS